MDKWGPQELASAFRFATDWFGVYVEEVNALNVYPVPDGDTGTNMHLTLQSVRRELDLCDNSKMREVARALAYGSLLGARGNSGVILSQLLKGFSEAVKRADSIGPDLLVKALETGARSAYKAVMKPVEGTILTVARGVAEGARSAQEAGADSIESVLAGALARGRELLEQTPEMLPVLKTAGVVDAGGMGYIRLLEGLEGFVLGRELPEPPKIERRAQEAFEEEEYGYCTEFLMEDVDAPIEKIKELVKPFGDSLLVVGAEGFVKGHIHTNDPDALLAAVARYGKMKRTKVEDMSEQHSEILSAVGAADVPPPPTGLVAVASGWGVIKALRGLGARIVSGGQTQNPSVQDILDAIKSVPNPSVIVLPNNKNIILAAEKAAELAEKEGKKVYVLPTRTMGQGLAAAVLYSPEAEAKELLEEMKEAAEHAVTFEITHASRDAVTEEVGSVQEGQVIGLKDGKLAVVTDNANEALLNLLKLTLDGSDDYEILTLFHSPSVEGEQVEALAEQISNLYPDLEVEVHNGGPDLYDYLAVLE
ncbi:DAK2 domain-containing protein [Oceanithermus sp.]